MSQSQPKLSGTFLVTGAHGLTRIAYTQDFNKRMSEWQAASPFPLHLVAAVTTPKSTTDLVQWLGARGAERLWGGGEDSASVAEADDDWEDELDDLFDHHDPDVREAAIQRFLETVNSAVTVLLAQPLQFRVGLRLADALLAHKKLSGEAVREIIVGSLHMSDGIGVE